MFIDCKMICVEWSAGIQDAQMDCSMNLLEALCIPGSLVKGLYERNIGLMLRDLANLSMALNRKLLYLQGLMSCKKFVICSFACEMQANPSMLELYNLSSKE
jgi:hypothetical protein